MNIEKLLEQGDWIALETADQGLLYGKPQNAEREYTVKQRNRLERIKEEMEYRAESDFSQVGNQEKGKSYEIGKQAAKQSAEIMEAEGKIIKCTFYNPINNNEHTVYQNSENFPGIKKDSQNNSEKIVVENFYRRSIEEIPTHFNSEVEMEKRFEEDKQVKNTSDSTNYNELEGVTISRLE